MMCTVVQERVMALNRGVRNDESKLTWTPLLVNEVHHPAFLKPTLHSFSVPLSAAVPVVKCFGTNFLILVLDVTSFFCIHKVSMVT